MKENIRKYALDLGVDDVGFASIKDYKSPRSPQIESLFPHAKSMIALAYKELANCKSPNMQVAMNGRLDVMEFSRACNYKVAKYVEREFKADAMSIPFSYPLEMSLSTSGAIADVSLRHAAVAAGLGVFGRHNIVIHPKFGTRVVFSALLSSLDLESDPPIKNELCSKCNICVNNCPAGALNEEGKTDIGKCVKKSQPYGLGANIRFWNKFVESSPEEQKKLFKTEEFWGIYQTGFIGFQYFCFNCMKQCPIGTEN